MQNKTNENSSTKYYHEEADTRTSLDPIYPPSAKLHDTNYSTSTISIQMTGEASDQQKVKISQQENQQEEEEEEEQEKTLTRMERFKLIVKYMRPMVVMLFFDVGLPLAVYYILKIWLSVLIALILSGIPPLLRVIYVFWKRRQIDILGCIFVVSFVLSAILSLISGDIRLTLLRDSTTTAIVSLMFFITLIPLKTKWFTIRPLIYLFSQQMMAESPPVDWTDIEGKKHSVERMEWIWQHCSIFRKYCYILCAIWGVMLMGEFVAKVIMIKSSLTIDQILLYGNIIVIAVVVTMTIGTTIASRFVSLRITAQFKEWRKENDFTKKLPK